MKEDILEQLVDDYLKLNGYFTQHNIKFSPRKDHPDFVSKTDSVHSDIDIIGFNPIKSPPENVWVVSCKSWQTGFDACWWSENVTTDNKNSGRPAWKFFRELVKPKWTEAFLAQVKRLTGVTAFTYVTAVTWLDSDRSLWEDHTGLRAAIGGNPIRILTLREMFTTIKEKTSTTPAASEIGRLVQLLKSAELLKK